MCCHLCTRILLGGPARCVLLSNGMNLGNQAIVDFAKPYFRREIVPKFPIGKSLLPEGAWAVFVTSTTICETAEAKDADDDFRFVWQMDTGLIRRDEDPKRYQRLIEVAGPLLHRTWHEVSDQKSLWSSCKCNLHVQIKPARRGGSQSVTQVSDIQPAQPLFSPL